MVVYAVRLPPEDRGLRAGDVEDICESWQLDASKNLTRTGRVKNLHWWAALGEWKANENWIRDYVGKR